MSDPIEQSDPVWFAALRRAHLCCDANARDQHENPNGHCPALRGRLLGRDAVRCYLNAAQAHEMAIVVLADLEVIDGASQSRPKSNKDAWGVSRQACVDCGQSFHPDSSPHMDRCWVCAEGDDKEPGR